MKNKLIIIIIIIIIGPHPIHTGKCVRICVSVWVLMLPRRGRLLHPRVNVQAMWVTSSLLVLVCRVTCDRYYTCSSCRLSLGASWPCSSAYMMASSPSAPNFFFHMYWKRSEHLASFPGSPGPLFFSLFFMSEYYARKIEGEGEPGTELRPPVATLASHDHDHGGHTLHCAQCRSRVTLWIVPTLLRSHKDNTCKL